MQHVLAAIRQLAQQQPDRVAIAEYDSSLSYAPLNNCADALARKLLKGNGKKDSVVGYLGFVTTDLIISLLAAHKAGLPFVYLLHLQDHPLMAEIQWNTNSPISGQNCQGSLFED